MIARPPDTHPANLPGRGIIRLSGPDRIRFAQSLFTNDLTLLDGQPVLYAALLTPQGRFLHDFFLFNVENTLLLECEGGARAEDLARRLNAYRLRTDVNITVQPHARVTSLLPGAPRPGVLPEGAILYPDPRHKDMGSRILLTDEVINQERRDFALWDRHRIALCIPDGSRDILQEQDTVIEAGLDRLHGVSFTKGCYVGQELTARLHHRGLTKKRLYTVQKADGLPPAGADIRLKDGHLAGQMRSSCRDRGLALLRDDAVDALKQEERFVFPGP